MENNIRRFRRELDKSQAWLAKAAGVSRQMEIIYEYGRSEKDGKRPVTPSQEVQERIAAALGRSVADIWPKPKRKKEGSVTIKDA